MGKVHHGTVLRSKILPPARARQPDDNANFVSAGSFSLGDALERYGESCRPAVVCTECMARPRSASGFLRLSLDQLLADTPAGEKAAKKAKAKKARPTKAKAES